MKLKREIVPGQGPTTENARFCQVEVQAKGQGEALFGCREIFYTHIYSAQYQNISCLDQILSSVDIFSHLVGRRWL